GHIKPLTIVRQQPPAELHYDTVRIRKSLSNIHDTAYLLIQLTNEFYVHIIIFIVKVFINQQLTCFTTH
ncbi:hypothetical protein, partial [Marinomonas arenicola]